MQRGIGPSEPDVKQQLGDRTGASSSETVQLKIEVLVQWKSSLKVVSSSVSPLTITAAVRVVISMTLYVHCSELEKCG